MTTIQGVSTGIVRLCRSIEAKIQIYKKTAKKAKLQEKLQKIQ
jgi:hypothetical protein